MFETLKRYCETPGPGGREERVHGLFAERLSGRTERVWTTPVGNVIAHVGGRYADLHQAHDGRIERTGEVHSAWGPFEWLLHDAFAQGYRVGVVCHSDDHKGRPGASHPGRRC